MPGTNLIQAVLLLMNKAIIVPTKLKDISLYQYLEFEKLPDTLSDNDRAIQTVSIFCKLTTEDVKKMPVKVLQDAIEKIEKALSDDPKMEMIFEFNGVEYGFIPNLDNITTAEFIDIENYQKNRDDLYKIMSVLYRPVTIKEGKRYDVEAYAGKVNDDFIELPMSYVKGAMVFFCNLGADLINYIQRCLQDQKQKDSTMQELQHLVKNGGGLDLFTDLLKETYLKLTLWHNYQFTKPYCGKVMS